MKKIYLLFLILFAFTTSVTVAQSSHDKISYQSVVRDGSNHLLYDTQVTVAVSIKNSGDAAVKYSETHTVTSNANGLISFLIGDGNSPSGNWDAVQWNRAEITMVTSVGGVVLSTHTLPLSAVPYALYAKNAGAASYADSVDINVVKHYVDQQGFLTEEVQVLSISNDTIFLTGGSWVKLPAGFSGDYNDLTNKPDLKPVATSGDYNDLVNKPENLVQDANYVHTDNNYTDAEQTKLEGIQAGAEVNVQSDWEQDDQSADDFIKNKPDLSQYATKNALRDTAGNIRGALVDTASEIRGALVDTAAAIRADMGDAANDAKITIQKNGQNVGDFTLNQATDDTINIPVPTKVTDLEDADDYVTKAKLNDTLGAYYDTTLTKEAIHDTADVLRGEFPVVNNGQINIAVNRGTVTNSSFTVNQDGEQTVTINIPDEVIVNDGKLTLIKSAGDTTLLFTANQSGNDTLDLSGYYDTTHVKKAINDSLTKSVELTIKSDSLFLKSGSDMDTVKLPAAPTQVQSNWKEANTSSAAYIQNKPNIRDSVNKVVKDSLMLGTTAINIAIDTIARNNIHDTATVIRNSLKDTVNHYIGTKTLTIKQGTNTLGTFNANQSDNDVEVNIPVPDVQVQSNWKETNTSSAAFIQNKPNIRDSVNKVVKDSLMVGTSAINIAIDTIARNNIHDTATVIRNSLKDTVNHYIGTKTLTIKQGTNTLGTFNANQSDNDVEVNIPVPDVQVQSNWKETNTSSAAFIQNKPNIRDSVNIVVKDSLRAANSAINQAIDTIACHNIHDTAVAIRMHIRDSVNVVMLDSLAAANSAINHAIDTIAGNAIHDSLSDYKIKNCTDVEKCMETTLGNYVLKTAVRDSVNKAVTDALKDPTSVINYAVDTIARNNIHDTAMAIRLHIRDSVNVVMLDSLAAANSAINKAIDTIARNNIHDTAMAIRLHIRDSVNVVMLDSLAAANSAINKAIDTIARNNIHDTAMAIRMHIRDSVNVVMLDSLAAANSAINKAIDTIAGNAIHDSLSDYKIKNCTDVEKCMETTLGNYVLKTAVRDSVNNAVTDALKDPTSVINYAVDTIARNNIHDTAMAIRLHIRDSVNVVMLDSLAAANSAINKAIDTIARNNIHDTAMAIRLHIRDSVNVVMLDSLAAANSAINKAIDTIARNNIHDTAMAIRLHIRDSVNVVMLDSLAAANSAINQAIDTIARNNIHDTAVAIRTHIRDSVNVVMLDSLAAANSAINKAIDTIAQHNIYDTAMAIRLHIRDSVNVVMLDSLAAANSAINKAIDTIARNNIHDTAMAIRMHIRDSVNVVMLDSLAAANSAINHAIDTIAGNAIHDSLSDYKIKNCTDVEKCMETTLGNYVLKTAVRDSVNNAVTDALKDPTSVINYAVDTIARNNIHDTAMAIRLHIRDSVNVVMLDSLEAANSAINKAIDTIARNNIHDTAMAIRQHIRDSVNVVMLDSLEAANSAINKAIDTIARNNIHDTAVAIRMHIRDSVNVVMLDSLEAANSAINKAIDTIARNNIHDTAMAIRLHIRDSVNVVMLDSLEAANSAINKAIDTIARNNIHDTAMAIRLHIRDSVNVVMLDSLAAANSAINKAIDTIAQHNIHDTAVAIRALIPTVPTNVSAFTNDAKYVNNASCDSLDFCALMAKVNAMATSMNNINNTINNMQHTIDSLEGVIDALSSLLPKVTLTTDKTTASIGSGDVASVICTATLKNASGYTLYWKVDGTDSTSNHNTPFTVNFTTVGTHKIVCTAKQEGSPDIKDSVTITITKGTPTVNVTMATGLVYTGAPQALVTAGSTTGGTLQYKLNDGAYSTDIPEASAVGSYTVSYKVVGNDNWNDVDETSEDVTIAKMPINPTVSITGWTSCEPANIPSVTGNTGNAPVTYEYKVNGADDNTYGATIPVSAGEYTIRATVAETANYSAGVATADFTIAAGSGCEEPSGTPATILVAPTATPGTITSGTTTPLVTEGQAENGTMMYAVTTSAQPQLSDFSTTVPTAAALTAGTCYVWYYAQGIIPYINSPIAGPIEVTVTPPPFSVGSNKKVYFAPANLQASTSDYGEHWTWQFAPNEWDYVGATAYHNTRVQSAGTVKFSGPGKVDLFSWVGASNTTWSGELGTTLNAAMHGIADATSTNSNYGSSASDVLKSDWGNTINDGHNWRTPTSEEWAYLLGIRASGSTVAGKNGNVSNARYTLAKINTDGSNPVRGLIIFPDGITIEASEFTQAGFINREIGETSADTWEKGTLCTTAQWAALSAKGCVFLPTAGYRYHNPGETNPGVSGVTDAQGYAGQYWSSSPSGTTTAYFVLFTRSFVDPRSSDHLLTISERRFGLSVRLVRDAE